MEARPAITSPPKPVGLEKDVRTALRVEDVTFSYPSRANVTALSRVSFAVHAGERVALVGSSGAGKSTLFELLLRFQDPQHGRITLGGHDLRDLSLSELRGRVAIVPQEPVLFSGAIIENIRFGRPEATFDQAVDAARLAFADEFIQRFPEGYATQVGDVAARMSGGERQRIAIARAFLRDADLLLLDEPTSALDSESQRLVHKAIDRLSRGRTTLVITHRLEMLNNCDRVIFLDHGELSGSGAHHELIRTNPLYARLCQTHFEAGESAGPAASAS
jgi:ATP-binding cassette subfamily B protein